MKNSNFFDTLSSNYDEMINFENSLKNKTESLKNYISSNYKLALDLGCGTGLDSIALSKLGLIVDAVDQSKGMLEQALKNSQRLNVKINFIQSYLNELIVRNKRYDLIVSLGNTIANLSKNDLKGLLDKLSDCLDVNGRIVIQIINYSNLPISGEYILNKFENELISITRKYIINSNDIDFIIDKVDRSIDEESHIATKLFPHSANTFKQFAQNIGFSIELYSSLSKEPYFKDNSKNLVIELKKQI